MPNTVSADALCDESYCECRSTVSFCLDVSSSMINMLDGFTPQYIPFCEDLKKNLHSNALPDTSAPEGRMLSDSKSTMLLNKEDSPLYPDSFVSSQDTTENAIPVVFLVDTTRHIDLNSARNIVDISPLYRVPDMPLLPLSNYRVRYRAYPQLIWKLSDWKTKIRRQKRNQIFG